MIDTKSQARTDYLVAAYVQLRADLCVNAPPVDRVALAFSFTISGARSGKRIGEHHRLKESADEKSLIVIHPRIWSEGDAKVLSTLVHEMVHAALPPKAGHKRPFAILAAAAGLEKPWRATTPGPLFLEWLNKHRADLPPFPGGVGLEFVDEKPKQTTRMRKYACVDCDPPVIIRAATDELQARCLDCGTDFLRDA